LAVTARFAILVYDGVEPIDVGGTFGVLSMAKRVEPAISMFLVAADAGPVRMANGLTVIAEHGYGDCPPADVLMVLGGPGWPAQAENADTLAFIRRMAPIATVASVCTGGMILAAAGVLAGRPATTKCQVFGQERSPLSVMGEKYPDIDTVAARLVDCGPVVTGGGVTLCIDATLHMIERLCGAATAAETARIIEYREAWQANKNAYKTIVQATGRKSATARP
jgi:transcriptional regulator GlxA family with amidase domain